MEFAHRLECAYKLADVPIVSGLSKQNKKNSSLYSAMPYCMGVALLSFRLMNVHFIGLFAFIASGLFTYRFRSWLAKCEESAYWVAAVIMDVL